MSNIGQHMKAIDDLKIDSYDYHYIDVETKFDEIEGRDTDGILYTDAHQGKEIGEYAWLAAKQTRALGEKINNMLKPETQDSATTNYFEPTYMPCYTRIFGSKLVIPAPITKYNYVINKKNDNHSHIDNLVQNTTLDIQKTDENYNHFYKFEKQFVIYNELISAGNGDEIKVGKWPAHSNSVWDNSVYTRLNGGGDWHPPPTDEDTVLQHEFYVLKPKPPYKWVMYHSDKNNITNENDPSWREGWKDHSRWLKIEYKNIVENTVRAWFIIENIRHEDGIENLNYELNGLFDSKTYRCKKISMPISGGCSGQMNISDTDYNFLQNKHKDLFNKCNVSGFQNEYTKVKKQLGSGYIFASGLLILYLIHRLFNRK